jgi:hypothetical protein
MSSTSLATLPVERSAGIYQRLIVRDPGMSLGQFFERCIRRCGLLKCEGAFLTKFLPRRSAAPGAQTGSGERAPDAVSGALVSMLLKGGCGYEKP